MLMCLVQCSLWTPACEATSSSAAGLLSQTVDIPQLSIAPQTAVASSTAGKLVVKATPQSTKILTAAGTVLLAFAGGLLLLGKNTQLLTWLLRSSEKEVVLTPEEEAAFAAKREQKEMEAFMSSMEVKAVRTEFDRVRKKEKESESKLEEARALLSKIEYSVGQSSKTVDFYANTTTSNATSDTKETLVVVEDEDANLIESATVRPRSSVLVDELPAGQVNIEGSEERGQQLLKNLVAEVKQAGVKAKQFYVGQKDMLQDLNATRKYVAKEPVVKLPPPLEETEFADWPDAMKDYVPPKRMQKRIFFANETGKEAAKRNSPFEATLEFLEALRIDDSALKRAFEKLKLPNFNLSGLTQTESTIEVPKQESKTTTKSPFFFGSTAQSVSKTPPVPSIDKKVPSPTITSTAGTQDPPSSRSPSETRAAKEETRTSDTAMKTTASTSPKPQTAKTVPVAKKEPKIEAKTTATTSTKAPSARATARKVTPKPQPKAKEDKPKLASLFPPKPTIRAPASPQSEPLPAKEDDPLQKKYSTINDLGDRAFEVLKDLGMVEPPSSNEKDKK